jgi:type II secretory pathway pseudopilin PulG
MNSVRNKRRSLPGQRGITLVELLFTMSACAVLFSLSAVLLQRVMQTQLRARAVVDLQRTLLRFDEQVRADVHQARAAESDPDNLGAPTFLRLQLAGEDAVEYRRQNTSIERVLLMAEEVKSREVFKFPREIEPIISRPQPRILALSITADEVLLDSPPVHVYIEAALPRDSEVSNE